MSRVVLIRLVFVALVVSDGWGCGGANQQAGDPGGPSDAGRDLKDGGANQASGTGGQNGPSGNAGKGGSGNSGGAAETLDAAAVLDTGIDQPATRSDGAEASDTVDASPNMDVPPVCDEQACNATAKDGCCPKACNSLSDMDCSGSCGNEIVESGEYCDPPSNCPTTCSNKACSLFQMQGSPAQCTARCVAAGQVSMCKDGDGCCPPGCNATNDKDCTIVCGNGIKEGSETCDPLSSCPTTCPPDKCALKKLVNGGTCTAECVPAEKNQTVCMSGDSCCPGGCNNTNDNDCAAKCGNNVKETGEMCDPCPTSCPAMGCQLRKLMNAGTCTASCVNDKLQTACISGDGCCPSGCNNNNNDTDCPAACGNGAVENGETCDPVSQCTSAQSACVSNKDTVKTSSGDASKCTYKCTSATRACGPADGNCPTGCATTADPDCKKPDGQACTSGAECVSNTCTFGTCCTGTACPNCKVDTDCSSATAPVCTGGKCSKCASNDKCRSKNSALPICVVSTGACVECDASSQCTVASRPICQANVCKACDAAGAGGGGACSAKDKNKPECQDSTSSVIHGQCVACKFGIDCDQNKAFCNPQTGQCETCLNANTTYSPDAACVAATASVYPYCHATRGVCTKCWALRSCDYSEETQGTCSEDGTTCVPNP